MKKNLLLLFLVLSFGLNTALAQMVNPVSWTYTKEKISENEYDLIITASIEKGWHLYGMDFPEGGPIPLVISFDENPLVEFLGKIESKSKIYKEFDDIFEIDITYYDGKAVFSQKIKVDAAENAKISGTIEGQACQESGQCVMVSDEFEFSFGESITESKAVDGEVKENNFDLTKDAKSMSLWAFFIASFLGGLIALLTPCIYPMIPMTVSYFLHSSTSKVKSRSQAMVYGLSIVLIFVLVGTIVAVTLGERFTNFISTHWLPNVFFFALFTLFAASFFGMFEITLPSWLVNRSDKQADKGGYLGAFFMALTLVIVSFSCTAPIVGTILALSTQGEVILPVIGMLGFSLAFAIPFTLFAIFPTALQKLPKSGGWLNSVKVVLGFIELALGLKFLSVADQTYHWGLLDREIYIALWIVIFTLMGIYLLGKIKFAHDSDFKHLSVPRLLLVIVTFTFVVYLVPGMFGAPLKSLAGWLPPQQTHDFDLLETSRKNSYMIIDELKTSGISQNKVLTEDAEKVLGEKRKYADKLHLPHGIKGYFDMEQAMAVAKVLNKPILIDFTGHGCVNCREMEAKVWSDPKVLKRLKNDYIVLALYVDDKVIQLPEEEWIKDEKGRTIKSLGKKNFYYQTTRFKANAQPYYVLMGLDGEPLVKPRVYNLNIDEFVDFLDKGKEEFYKKF